MTSLCLHKLHATGNDFLVLDAFEDRGRAEALSGADVVALCDRHRGVGADGLLVLGPPSGSGDVTMTLYNADGGVAELSGNGIRALADVAVRRGLGDDGVLNVATDAGIRVVHFEPAPGAGISWAEVDMGSVTFDPAQIPLRADEPFGLEATFHGVTYRGDAAGMGNPHFVLFVDAPADARVTTHGPRLEYDERFPERTNVEFVAVSGPDELTLRVWERGVGETLSCGTGACAAAAAAHRRGLVGEQVTVRVLGGVLEVRVGEPIRLAGPVVHVFRVDVDPGALRAGAQA